MTMDPVVVDSVVHGIALDLERKHGLEVAADLASDIAHQEAVHDIPTRGLWASVAALLERRNMTIRMGFAGVKR